MILRIVAVNVCGPRHLDVTFNNGVRKRVNVSSLLNGPIFEPLRTRKGFAEATLDDESGTVVWPNGADFAPEALLELSGTVIKPSRAKQRAKQKTRS